MSFFGPLRAEADFSAPYYLPTSFYELSGAWPATIGDWALTNTGSGLGGYVNTFIATNSSSLILETGLLAGNGLYTHYIYLTDTIAADGILSFDYVVTSAALSPTMKLDQAGYLLDGIFTALPTGTGSVSIPLRSGDLFTFDAEAYGVRNGCNGTRFYGDARLSVTNFNAPVPEPTALFFLSVGIAVALAGTKARK